jgi:hypothetical protein
MLSNWTKATTTTTGTGTITLTSVTGFPRPSDIFGVDTYIQYSIVAANGSKESGIGKTASSNTLERSRILSTWNGSTYTEVSPSAISLPSGTHEVFFTPIADGLFEAVGSPASFAAVGSSQSIISTHLYGGYSSLTLTLQKLHGVPCRVENSGVLTHIGAWVATAGAGSEIRVGLYDMKPDGHPGKLLATTTTALDSTSTGLKINTVATQIKLKPGWYWAAILALNGTAPQVHSSTPSGTPFGMGGASNWNPLSFVNAASITSLPDPFTSLTNTSTNWTSISDVTTAPRVLLRMT